MLFYSYLRALLIIEIFETVITLEKLNKLLINELPNFGWQNFYKKIIGHLRENWTKEFINDLLANESPILRLINLSIKTSEDPAKNGTNSTAVNEQQKSIESIANYIKNVTNWAKFEQMFLLGQEAARGASKQFLVPKIHWQLAQRIRAHFGTEIGRLSNLNNSQAIDVGFAGIRQKMAKLVDICQQTDKILQMMLFIRLSTEEPIQDKSGTMNGHRLHRNDQLLNAQLDQLRKLFNTEEQHFGTEHNAIWSRETCGGRRMVSNVCQVMKELRKLAKHWHELSLQLYISTVCTKKVALGSISQRRHGSGDGGGMLPYRNAMF